MTPVPAASAAYVEAQAHHVLPPGEEAASDVRVAVLAAVVVPVR
jgi:hypothetical protein